MTRARFAVFVATFAALAGMVLLDSSSVIAAGNAPDVQLNIAAVAPRQVEQGTEQAITRDYAKAWQALATARDQNRPELLQSMFVGVAKNEIEQAIRDQQKSNARVRYVDLGHKLQAVFYSQEGSAMQLRDTAFIETQILDGNSVVYSEDAVVNYIVVMTPAADHWQVRMLQAVPSF
jgi:acyl-CoA-binding protein